MLITILTTIGVFALLIGAMAIGVIVSGKRLRGSCGGTGTNCECAESKQRTCEKKKGQLSPEEVPVKLGIGPAKHDL